MTNESVRRRVKGSVIYFVIKQIHNILRLFEISLSSDIILKSKFVDQLISNG